FDPSSEFFDRNLVPASDVENSPHRTRALQELKDRPDRVLHVGEGPRLPSITEHRDRFPRQRLADEARNYHAVPTCLAGPYGIEQAHDGDRQLLLLVVGQCQEFVDYLGGRITPASLEGRTQDEVAVF